MIKVDGHFKRSYQNATGRWSAVGPYYAMFPIEFAFDVVERHSQKGDWILDPFAGRYSSIYAAATQERYGLGLEIHPVGWVYGQAKYTHRIKKRCGKSVEGTNPSFALVW